MNGVGVEIAGHGNGPIDAFFTALKSEFGLTLRLSDFREHALGQGSNAEAIAYVEVMDAQGRSRYGAGRHESSVRASLAAVVSAVNRSLLRGDEGREERKD